VIPVTLARFAEQPPTIPDPEEGAELLFDVVAL
jgi:hypothetical protein